MEIKWVKRGNAKTLEDAITARSGMSAQELKTPADSYPEDIENMVEAAIRIKEAIDNKEIINVFGDYDADGVCSVAILYLMFDYFGVHPVTRLPKAIICPHSCLQEMDPKSMGPAGTAVLFICKNWCLRRLTCS